MRITSSFIGKILAAAGLVALGDRLFWQGQGIGSNLGVLAMAWAIVTALMVPAIRHNRGAMVALVAAAILAATLVDQPNPLAVCLFWALLSCTALLPRYARFDHVGRWALRLFAHGMLSVGGPWVDLFRLRKQFGPMRGADSRRLLALLPLPLIGGLIFFGLFASANPIIGDALLRIGAPDIDIKTVARGIFWTILLIMVWATLRPFRVMLPFSADYYDPKLTLPGVSTGSVRLALITFNALFALQNGLDIAYLWSGAPLPSGVTLADYAHRSAYPLIVTALLAGLFVLVTLRPGSDTAAVPLIRRLVVLWIVQNVFLVASSMLRTIDYIEVYSLTRLRIAALVWMVLVAIGLVLIVWRMLKGRSGAWLINANALAAGIALMGCSVTDIGSLAAAWNVRHAKEVGGEGAALDLCYLNSLGSSALVSIVELDQRPGLDPAFAKRLAWVRHLVLVRTGEQQKAGEWIWRDARRLDQVRSMLGGKRMAAPPSAGATGRGCDGAILPAQPMAERDEGPADSANADGVALTNEVQR
jgi:hypothetical protein